MNAERNSYFKELAINLRHAGFTVGPETDGLLPVELDGQRLCLAAGDGRVRYREEDIADDSRHAALDRATAVVRATSEYMSQMETAPPLTASGLEGDYRVLAEFNDTVLAGHPTKYGCQFVTWERVQNRTALHQGDYYGPGSGTDCYASAKRDFAVRSGLVPGDALFSPEQLTEVYRSMREFGYSESSLKTYRYICARIVHYFEEQGVERFNVDLGQKFIVEYGGDHYGAKGTLKNYCRAVRMLSDLQQHGMIFKQTLWPKKEFSPGFRSLYEAFVQYNRNRGIAEDSVRHLRWVLARFEDYLLNRGVHAFQEVECQYLNAYVETLAGYGRNTVSFHISYLNRLMKYALQQGYYTHDLSAVMPCVKYGQSKRLPAVFTEDEIKRILENVNTDSPVGKRNYAIILLLARLGIRISDILNLQFDSIDWERKRISIQQQKIGTQVELPLLEDVGWAIIDYLQNGRPQTSCPNVFVCHNPPFDRIHSWLAKDISRAVQKAGIRVPRGKTAGTHIFRHPNVKPKTQNKISCDAFCKSQLILFCL